MLAWLVALTTKQEIGISEAEMIFVWDQRWKHVKNINWTNMPNQMHLQNVLISGGLESFMG